MWYKLNKEDEEHFIEVCREATTMAEAARKLNMHFNTFKKFAVKLGCYNPNQSGKGLKKKSTTTIKTIDILNGLYPNYQTYKLKCRLIREGIKEDKCEICGWNKKRNPDDEFTPCELHHIDGNYTNHSLDNLIILCPNCHSLTDNYRSLNATYEHIGEKSQ